MTSLPEHDWAKSIAIATRKVPGDRTGAKADPGHRGLRALKEARARRVTPAPKGCRVPRGRKVTPVLELKGPRASRVRPDRRDPKEARAHKARRASRARGWRKSSSWSRA
ncbi:hypothetical protein GCM10010381_00890 [Streptomyces xantholiticus]|nr:hypothetical protein GCM10010381_00890 [Streptomyces xantholiticus]